MADFELKLRFTEPCAKCDGTGRVTDHTALGADFQQKRRAAGYTLRQIASLMGISIGYLSDLEHGRKHWSLRQRVEYLSALWVLDQEKGVKECPKQ